MSKTQSTLRQLQFVINPAEALELGIFCDYVRVKTSAVEVSIKTREGDDFTLVEGEEALLGDTRNVIISHQSGVAQTIILIFGINAKSGSSKLGGAVSVSGAVALDAATLAALESITVQSMPKVKIDAEIYGSAYANNTVLVANTPIQVFSAAANVNGAIIHLADITSQSPANGKSLIAKATAPASVIDGDVLLLAKTNIISGAQVEGGQLIKSIFVAAGKALYWISASTETVGHRSVLYTLL